MNHRIFYFIALCGILLSLGASHRTRNFIVVASTPELARVIADDAEQLRYQMAMEWLETELAPWSEPCRISVRVVEDQEPRGETSYIFVRGEPVDWQMHLQGTREQIRRSVLPHEITHTVFASRFGRPLPRWAEEGACVMVERKQERSDLEQVLLEQLAAGRYVDLRQMIQDTPDTSQLRLTYATGYSLVRFLLGRGGKQKFIRYLEYGLESRDWGAGISTHYGYASLDELHLDWLRWAQSGGSNGHDARGGFDRPTHVPDRIATRTPHRSVHSYR
jgi:hypothetical protein